MKRFAKNTTVPISKTRMEIDRLLRDWDADGIQWSDEFRSGRVILRFIWRCREGRFIARFVMQLSTVEQLSVSSEALDGRTGMLSQKRLDHLLAARGKVEHRLLLLWLKAALNAVEGGLVAPEAIFLPFLEGSDGKTFSETALPRLSKLLAGTAERLLPERTS